MPTERTELHAESTQGFGSVRQGFRADCLGLPRLPGSWPQIPGSQLTTGAVIPSTVDSPVGQAASAPAQARARLLHRRAHRCALGAELQAGTGGTAHRDLLHILVCLVLRRVSCCKRNKPHSQPQLGPCPHPHPTTAPGASNSVSVTSKSVCSTGHHFDSPGTFGNTWGHLWLSKLKGWVLLASSGQRPRVLSSPLLAL